MDTPLRQAATVATPRARPHWTPRTHADRYIGRSLDDGRFLIRKLIAQGGMSDVFLADDRQGGRPVAIKILRSDDIGSSEGRRFVREARVLANLQHPNLVAVLATGETDEGNPYMVQPHLGGDTLRARLAGGPLGWRVALEIGVQIADVLHALHEAGVVHRDVKLDNIIWARHPTQPVWVKLIDLGIAKLLGFEPPPIEGAAPLDRRATGIGYVLGTEGYRPPEALEGICTPRFDVFSLGVTLFRLCANVMPQPDVRPLAEMCPGWDGPADFEAAIRKAMDPDPERRFASAEAFRLMLEAIRTCHPEPDRPRHLFAGRFDLINPLGSGAKATTYSAYNRELEATAAIKIMNAKALADPDECLRFIREAMILRHVRHPNIPAFFELDTYAGQRYIAMELCRGKRAGEYILPTTCLRAAEVIRIGEQLASALKALHEAGVIYRDLNWDNVLIHFDDCDRDPVVKLIDFNASLLIEDRFFARLDERWARPPEQRERPSKDLQLETMRYAAPEVRAGAPWSEGSDVFALGMLLYLLLTGQVPFPGGEPKGTMTPPWRKDCPEHLIWALESALQIDPAERGPIDNIIELLTLAREELEYEEKATRDAARVARNAECRTAGEPSAELAPAEPARPAELVITSSQPSPPVALAIASAEPDPPAEPAPPVAELAADHPERSGASPAILDEVVSRPVGRRSSMFAVIGILLTGALVAVRSLLPDEDTGDAQAVVVDLAPEPGPARNHVDPEPEPPTPAPAPFDLVIDMETTLARVADSLHACAREAGRRITVELAVEAGAGRFTSITVVPAETSVDRCIRAVLDPLRFLSQPAATTFITQYRP